MAKTVPRQLLNHTRREWFKRSASLLLIPLIPHHSQAETILAVRVWPANDYTRVTLEYDTALKTSHQIVKDPERLVVDIEGVDLNTALRDIVSKIQPNDPYIQQVRVGQNRPKVVRLVLDLKQEINPQIFTLAPVAEYKHRLVIDLYPRHPIDPLLALLDKNGNQASAERNSVAPPQTSSQPSSTYNASNEKLIDDSLKMEGQSLTKKSAENTEKAPLDKTNAQKTPAGKAGIARLVTIALDPGHGGEDPGAIGRGGTHEKFVALSIAKRLQEKIDALPNMRAMLTREGDYFVPLHVRVQKARRVQADLFVSIHADAFVKPDARGSSVFALSERGATSTAARWLANKENAADLIGGINLGNHNRQLAQVLLDLSTTAQINDSLQLGRVVLKELSVINRLHKADVEQAGFAVLKAPDIPSILIETAFISNPEEEEKLADEGYQDRMAEAIAQGIKRYFAKYPPAAKSKLT